MLEALKTESHLPRGNLYFTFYTRGNTLLVIEIYLSVESRLLLLHCLVILDKELLSFRSLLGLCDPIGFHSGAIIFSAQRKNPLHYLLRIKAFSFYNVVIFFCGHLSTIQYSTLLGSAA